MRSMKRDMELIRRILSEIEAHEDLSPIDIKGNGFSPDQINYHLKLLCEAGYIEAVETGTMQNRLSFIVTGLTWKGHEFLDLARNNSVWQKMKTELKDHATTLPFELIQKLLLAIAASEFPHLLK
jgi:hypothetical protein